MTLFVGFSIIVLLALLIQNKIKPSLLFFGLLLIYYFLDLITIQSLLNNFVNTSLVTLILLLVISIAIEKVYFVESISNKLFTSSFKSSIFRLSFFTSFFSAFLNNTAVVATMISVIKKNTYHSPSKLLLPLSYSAIFGGVITLIGTSTNLIINGFMIERGLKPLELFDFAYVGLPIAIIGAFVLYFIAKKLPDTKIELQKENYFLEALVNKGSKLIGKSIKDNKLRNLKYLYLSEILRDGKIISPVSPEEIILKDDILIFSGDIKEVKILKNFDLQIENIHHKLDENLLEVIVSNEANIVNKTLKEINFRTKFDASVVAIKRADEKLSGKIGDIRLNSGDNLILSIGNDFHKRDNIKKNFYLLGNINLEKSLSKKESYFIVASFLSVILLSFFKILAFIKGLFILVAIYVLFGLLKTDEIKRRFPYELILIIGSSLGIASVMIDSGLSTHLANFLNYTFSSFGVYGMFISIYLFTFILTEIITNNAAAALSFPIAYSSAIALDVSILPFVMAVVYGASASFMTPYGYQTNLMVASVGGYNFKTFLKNGAIISIVYSLLVIILVPIFFPF